MIRFSQPGPISRKNGSTKNQEKMWIVGVGVGGGLHDVAGRGFKRVVETREEGLIRFMVVGNVPELPTGSI